MIDHKEISDWAMSRGIAPPLAQRPPIDTDRQKALAMIQAVDWSRLSTMTLCRIHGELVSAALAGDLR